MTFRHTRLKSEDAKLPVYGYFIYDSGAANLDLLIYFASRLTPSLYAVQTGIKFSSPRKGWLSMLYRFYAERASKFPNSFRRTVISAVLVGLAVFAQSVHAASDPQTVSVEGASVIYIQDKLWFSLPWMSPSFLSPISYEYQPYKDALNERLKAAGYETNVERGGIALAVFEDYAGRVSDYRQEPDHDTARGNAGAIIGTVALAVIGKAFGISAPLTVANNANSFVVRDLPNTQHAEVANSNPASWLVVARICSINGKKCGSSVAIATKEHISLNELREINMQEGLTRAVGLTPRPPASE